VVLEQEEALREQIAVKATAAAAKAAKAATTAAA